jgi:Flp pilus assembly protein TadD
MSTRQSGGKNGKRLACRILALALAAGVAGCAHDRNMTTGSIRPSSEPMGQMSSSELNSTLVHLGKSYAANPKDKAISLKYASALQMDGRTDQSLAVMRKAVIYYPKDRDILAAYGKALAADGQLDQALDAIRRAETPEYPDWRLVSAEAAILDQLGQTDEARGLYRKALDLKPNEPSVLSNLGMSYLLKGDLKTAETYMRSAVEQPGADSRVRQNLALVVGLQGRFGEAEKIASAELPPDEAAANIAYLRQMISQQNAWSQLKNGKKKKAVE